MGPRRGSADASRVGPVPRSRRGPDLVRSQSSHPGPGLQPPRTGHSFRVQPTGHHLETVWRGGLCPDRKAAPGTEGPGRVLRAETAGRNANEEQNVLEDKEKREQNKKHRKLKKKNNK